MAYEYSSNQAQLNYPNPYRVENILWSVRAGILLAAGLALIFATRSRMAEANGLFLVPMGLGVTLMLLAIWNFGRVFQQLRVYGGRGHPAGLAPELEHGRAGSSKQAEHLMQTIRQGALQFEIPRGPINGILYSLLEPLITAPVYVQHALQNRGQNLAAYLFLLLIMGAAEILVWGSLAQPWVGAFFLGLVSLMAVKPVSSHDVQARVGVTTAHLVALVIAAILGPVAVGMVAKSLPDLSWASFGAQAFVVLLALALVEASFFWAVWHHVDEPPGVSKVDTLDSVSFNSDPNLLMQEIDREMQRNWTLSIPNRCYARIPPQIELAGHAGNFRGTLLEETQPLAPRALDRIDWAAVMAYPRFFWLMVMNALGVFITLAGCGCLVAFAVQVGASEWRPLTGFATLGFALTAVAGYAFRSAHTLWGRFDFESTLTWVDMEGSFVRAKVDVGNRLNDRVVSQREVVNVESMTLRVWVVHLRSVVFGNLGQGSVTTRAITGMISEPEQASYLTKLVKEFAAGQSIVVAPTSTKDARRVGAIQALNDVAAPRLAAPAQQPAGRYVRMAAAATSLCSNCGIEPAFGDAFCSGCGTPLPAN